VSTGKRLRIGLTPLEAAIVTGAITAWLDVNEEEDMPAFAMEAARTLDARLTEKRERRSARTGDARWTAAANDERILS
jgi:hypothetical protein